MRSKLNFGIVIALLIFLGRYIDASSVPNQQIIIQFSDAQISKNNIVNTVEAIQDKLQSIGVEHIKVDQNKEGQLKITYFSSTDVEQIKNILSHDEGYKFAHNSGNSDQNQVPDSKYFNDYELNISEIQKTSNTNWDFESVEVVEINHKSDRFNNLKLNYSGYQANSQQVSKIVKLAVKSYAIVVLTIDNHSYKIPEVRAGPTV